MTSRLVSPDPHAMARSMAKHVRSLQEAGHDVVFFTSNLPAAELRRTFASHGVADDRLHMLDAISQHATNGTPSLRATTYLSSPTLLELAALRLEQMSQRVRDPHVIVCCLNTLALYNDRQLVGEFGHYLCLRFVTLGIPIDIILSPVGDDHGSLGDSVSPFVDERLELAA